MKKILFFVAAAVMMTVGCTKENPAPAGTDSQTPSGQEGEGKEDEKPEKTLTGYRAAYTYYVADEALDLSVVGAPKKLVAVYSDNSTAAVSDASAFTFSDNAQIAASEGDQTFSATYKGETVSVTIPVKKGMDKGGAADFNTTDENKWIVNTVGQLYAGQSATVKMFVYSSCANNWAAPVTNLCYGDWSGDFIYARMDHYAWGDSAAACTMDSNWNWGEGDTFPGFRPYQNHALVTVTVSCVSATSASIRYDVTYWNGETHFQSYTNIGIGEPMNFRFMTEGSYAVVYEVQKPEEGQQGGGDDPQGDKTLTGYRSAYNYYVADEALSLDVVGYPKKILAVYSDNTTSVVDASAFTFTAGQQITASEGVQTLSATYQGNAVEVSVSVVKGTDKGGDKGFNTNNTNKYVPYTVGQLTEVGQSATTKMFVYSACGDNWHAPVTDVCYGDWNGVFFHGRMDNFGWWEKNGDIWEAGNTFDNNNRAIELKSDWNWDTFKGFQNHAAVTVTVTVATETTAVVRYDVTYWNGEKHYQEYSNIGVGLPINWRFFTENSYAVVYE